MFLNYIIKGIGGFYYVKTADGIKECKAKGIFRKRKITPLAGDFVELENEAGSYVISEINERKNFFIRPPIANVDNFFIVVSTVQPVPSTLVIDKLCAIAIDKGAVPHIIVTKTDLLSSNELKLCYDKSGIQIIDASLQSEKDKLTSLLNDKINVFCGNSGVGKSTLLSDIVPNLNLQTGDISQKLGRGRHTTREVELFEAFGGLIADTPGFASLEINKAGNIPKENLEHVFPDIMQYYGQCKFTGCSHLSEKGCAVIQALNNGEINQTRYNSYTELYKQASEINDWQR